MRYLFPTSLLICLIFGSVACQPAQSPTPYPTYTVYPTYTPYPTHTPPPPTVSPLSAAEAENLIWPTGPRDDVIPFEDAGHFINERVTVEGTVIRTHNSGNVVFLNFSKNSESKFTAVIFPDDWSKFPAPPEDLFYGKLVRVEGVVQDYQGTPEIIIKDPWQIEVALTLGQPVVSDCDCSRQTQVTPTTIPTPLTEEIVAEAPITTETSADAFQPAPTEVPQPVISWQDAANFEGQTVTVQGKIVNTYRSDKVIFLNFDQDYRNTFKAVIFPDAWGLFPGPPAEYYRDKIVNVTGQVKLYKNSPEIVIDHPDQIVIME